MNAFVILNEIGVGTACIITVHNWRYQEKPSSFQSKFSAYAITVPNGDIKRSQILFSQIFQQSGGLPIALLSLGEYNIEGIT